MSGSNERSFRAHALTFDTGFSGSLKQYRFSVVPTSWMLKLLSTISANSAVKPLSSTAVVPGHVELHLLPGAARIVGRRERPHPQRADHAQSMRCGNGRILQGLQIAARLLPELLLVGAGGHRVQERKHAAGVVVDGEISGVRTGALSPRMR